MYSHYSHLTYTRFVTVVLMEVGIMKPTPVSSSLISETAVKVCSFKAFFCLQLIIFYTLLEILSLNLHFI